MRRPRQTSFEIVTDSRPEVPDGWQLPSGTPLAEFVFRAGFLAPRLFGSDRKAEPSTIRANRGSRTPVR